jgi:tRNA(Ile)-lysidine synthetase-like protein
MTSLQKLFFRHVEGFLLNHHPHFSPSVMVAVSGGVDSMLLLQWAHWMKTQNHIKSLRVVTVHHNTRLGQDADVELVVRRANELGLEVVVVQREEGGARDEFTLREFRYQKLFSFLRAEEELWMAHHLNDSWEWAQLQMSRSSELKAVLGIPFKSGPILRPFLCVTKAQILKLAQHLQLEWREDPTNAQAGYARFLFRQNLAPQIALQHPQYLKHYAYRSQRLAEQLGLAWRKKTSYQIHRSQQGVLICGLCPEQVLVDEVKQLSQSKRGSLHREAQKILAALKKGKRGPFTLSGGVKVSLYSGWMWIYSQDFTPPVFPQVLRFENMNRHEFEEKLKAALGQKLFWAPFWVVFNSDFKSRNTLVKEAKDALWAQLSEYDSVISAPKLLQRWKDPQQILSLALPW